MDDEIRDAAEAAAEGRVTADAPVAPAPGAGETIPLASYAALAPAPPAPWRARDLGLFVAFALVWLLISQFLSLAAYAVLQPLMGWRTPAAALGENAIFAIVAQLVFYAPLLLYVFLLVTRHYGLPFWEGIRWRWPGGRRAAGLFVGGMVLAVGLAAASSLIPEPKSFPLEKLFSSPVSAYLLAAYAVTVAPFMEELVFRAVLFAYFERSLGLTFAVAGTALLFAAVHIPEYWGAWTHVGAILVVGVVFSLTRALTRSLAPSVIVHAAYNATLMAGLYAGTHGFHTLQP